MPTTLRAGSGREHAFERLYQRYAQDVYRYTLALLRNPADAEDVTQTTFMNAYRAWSRGEVVEKPQNWLIRIAHNAARTKYARSLRRVPEVPLDEAMAELAVPEEDKPDVQEVLEALGELPFNQRAALVMRELEGRSYAEIAETLGVTQSSVEALIFRARRSLRLSRTALRGLTLVQLPSSLASFFDGPGAAVAGGGALLGSGLLLKAAAVVAAGAVAAGVGYTSVGAATRNEAPARGHIHPFALRSLTDARLVRAARVASAAVATRRAGTAPAADRHVAPEGARSEPTSSSRIDGGTASTGSGAPAAADPASTVTSTVASAPTPVHVPVQAPSVPPVQAPSVPVQVPSVPAVTAPALPKLP